MPGYAIIVVAMIVMIALAATWWKQPVSATVATPDATSVITVPTPAPVSTISTTSGGATTQTTIPTPAPITPILVPTPAPTTTVSVAPAPTTNVSSALLPLSTGLTYTTTPIAGVPWIKAIVTGDTAPISPNIMIIPASAFATGAAVVPTPYRYTSMNIPVLKPSPKSIIMVDSEGVKKGLIVFTPAASITVTMLTANPTSKITIAPYA